MKEWKHRCELKLLVCQPNPLRPDRVTIGYVLRDTNPEAARVEVRFAKNLGAVRCIYPDADIEAIEGTLLEMESVLKNVTDFEQHLLNMPADFPVDFALLSGGALLTDDFEKELPILERQYLGRVRRNNAARDLEKEVPNYLDEEDTEFGKLRVGRPYIRRCMQQAINLAGASSLMRAEIPVAPYTFPGDLLKIDFGHSTRPGEYRLLHATSVVAATEQAAILAAKWPDIRQGLERDLVRRCELIAITEAPMFTQSPESREKQSWLTGAGINIQPVTEMMRLANEAKKYLGA